MAQYECSTVNSTSIAVVHTGTGRANGTGMGFGSAILVKTYTGHSLFFHLSFKHQDDIQYYNYSSSFSPHFNIQYFNIFKIILNTNANANANARDLLSDVGKLS